MPRCNNPRSTFPRLKHSNLVVVKRIFSNDSAFLFGDFPYHFKLIQLFFLYQYIISHELLKFLRQYKYPFGFLIYEIVIEISHFDNNLCQRYYFDPIKIKKARIIYDGLIA